MQASLWNSLEFLSTQAALMVEWRDALGNDFEAARVFLRPTQQQAESYPCVQPFSCGCRHRVVFDSEDDVSAICDCEETGCEPICLNLSDLIVHSVDGKVLTASIRNAFKFDELENIGFGDCRSQLVGSWGARRSCVLFYLPISENGFLSEIDRLSSAIPDPCLLLTPTSRFCTPMVQRALRRQGHAQLTLAGIVGLVGPGHLELIPAGKPVVDAVLEDFEKRISDGTPLERAIRRVEDKLKAIAKNLTLAKGGAVSEEAAQGALAIVKKLDAGHRLKKATLMKVFHLYCIKGMSSRQIANECGCSRAMVTKRLKFLEEKLGMSPVKLRTHSAQFERMEDELTDSRARRIDRWKLAHENDDDEDETV